MPLTFAELPRPLQDDLRASRVVPLVGAGFSLNAELDGARMPTWAGLAKELDGDLATVGADSLDPIDVLSCYEQEHGRFHLTSRLLELLHVGRARPGRAHLALVQAPFEHILTTNFDLLLEEALQASQIAYFPVVEASQLAVGSSGRARVVLKIHGDVHHPDRMVLTEGDFDAWLLENPLLATEIASLFVRRTGLLLGYSLSDPDLRQILALLTARLGRMARPLYAIAVGATASEVRRFERSGVRVLELLTDRDLNRPGVSWRLQMPRSEIPGIQQAEKRSWAAS